MDLVATKDLHYIPGYTGYSPQYFYRTSDSYGTLTHKLLIDPCKSHAESIIISSRADDEHRIERPTLREVDLVKAHEKAEDPIFKFPTIPGYEGFIPFLGQKIGLRYGITATEGITQFEKTFIKNKCEAKKLRHTMPVQDKTTYNKSLGERNFDKTEYRLPLSAVRPDAIDVINNEIEIPPAPPLPYSKGKPPQNFNKDEVMNDDNRDFGETSPLTWPRFGQSDESVKNSIICDFVNDYNHRLSVEWPPIRDAGIGSIKPNSENLVIYVKHGGVLPNYAGHVPGEKFSFGKTYGRTTIDAKRFLSK